MFKPSSGIGFSFMTEDHVDFYVLLGKFLSRMHVT